LLKNFTFAAAAKRDSIDVARIANRWRATMMGEHSGSQGRFFYRFALEERVPADHLLRKIDAVLDLSRLRSQLAPHYSHTGRPSIDPELMIRMLLIGYCYGIRSERRLCEEVHLNLAYRWFCRLGLEDPVPDHSTFSKNRHALRKLISYASPQAKWHRSVRKAGRLAKGFARAVFPLSFLLSR
jgi:hypothetical protein